MDISESLKSAAKVKSILEAFPKHRRLPPIEELHPVRRLEEARQEVLMKCIPFLNKVGREIKSYAEGFDDRFFENIKSRKNYIESKLEESKAEVASQSKRARLIHDIERLEKNNSHTIERIVFDEEKSMRVIKYLHEQSYNYANYDLKDILESLIGLVYDRNCSDRVESYEKIMNLL